MENEGKVEDEALYKLNNLALFVKLSLLKIFITKHQSRTFRGRGGEKVEALYRKDEIE